MTGSSLLHDPLAARATTTPNQVVVTFVGDRGYDAATLWNRCRRAAASLVDSGAEPGSRVAILIGNRIEFVDTWLGCSIGGFVSVPLNTSLRGEVLRGMLARTAPVVIVAEADLTQVVDDIVPPDAEWGRVRVAVGDAPPASGWVSYDEWLSDRPLATAHPSQPRELASIMFTSGTTGPSKGVMYAHTTGLAMTDAAHFVLEYTADDVLYTCLPLYHANAMFISLLSALRFGGSVVIAPRFSASRFWDDVIESGATKTSILGSMTPILWRMPPNPKERAHRLQRAIVAPIPVEYYGHFEERFGFEPLECYGLTDANIVIGMPPGARRPGSCGKVLPWWEAQIVDEHDEPVAAGTVGELVLRPKRPFVGQLGYWGMPSETVDAWRNLWLHTGDYMRQDEEGWFYFVDRKKDAIRRFGENISSFEVEQVVLSHPSISEAAVYAVPSELAEDEVMVAVVLDPDAETVSAADLIAYCEPRLPYFAVPRYVDIRTSLPKTNTEKIRKDLLRAEGVTPTTFDRGPTGRRARERAGR